MLRIWYGMGVGAWVRLLARSRCPAEPKAWPAVLGITLLSPVNTVAGAIQCARWRRRVETVDLGDDPVFVIGHWRSGTTFLHHLLAEDSRFTWPDGFQCVFPHLHLLLGDRGRRWVRQRTPALRPMDAMRLDPADPQEDELALCNLGLPSPYARLAFPNRPLPYPEGVDLEGLSPTAQTHWTRTFLRFLREVVLQRPGRLLLKSPTHTFRIPYLLGLFPRARFVYLVRCPFDVIPSTIHTRQALSALFGLQRPDPALLRERVFEAYESMMRRYRATKDLIPPGQLHELRFEDLLADPGGRMADLYRALALGEPIFRASSPTLLPRRIWKLEPGLREEIAVRCTDTIHEYGYAPPEPPPSPPRMGSSDPEPHHRLVARPGGT